MQCAAEPFGSKELYSLTCAGEKTIGRRSLARPDSLRCDVPLGVALGSYRSHDFRHPLQFFLADRLDRAQYFVHGGGLSSGSREE